MNIKGDTITINKSQKETFEFLEDLNNFEQLMPDTIQKFEVEGDSLLFGLKGLPELRLIKKDKTEYSNIILGSASSKLDFELTADIKEISETQSEVVLEFAGKLNMMMSMMVKKPITSFIETLSTNLNKLS